MVRISELEEAVATKDKAHAAAIDREFEAEALARTLVNLLAEAQQQLPGILEIDADGVVRPQDDLGRRTHDALVDPAVQALLKD